MIFIVKVTTNKEDKAIEMIVHRTETKNLQVYAVAKPHGFKGEKAKVTRVDKAKGELVVSLLGASVPIPVAVKMDNVKVIRREKSESDEEIQEESLDYES